MGSLVVKLFMLVTHTMMNIFVHELWCIYQIICAGSWNSWGSASGML